MPNIASVLKEEITRLARKEVKAQTEATRKATAQYRRDIAQLKRTVDSLTRQVAYLEKQEQKRGAESPRTGDAEGRRFSARGLKTHRGKLGLSAAEYAELVGVSGQTIYNWENGKSKPRAEQLAALVAVRGMGKREAVRKLELLQG